MLEVEMEKDVRGLRRSAGLFGECIQVCQSGGHKRGPEDFWCNSALYSGRWRVDLAADVVGRAEEADLAMNLLVEHGLLWLW